MKLLRSLSVVFMLLSLTACASKYKQIELTPNANRPNLSKADPVFIATPENGRYEAMVYETSGTHTGAAFLSAFSRHVSNVYLESNRQSFEESLQNAKAKGSKVLAYPEITHWEDRATEWSGKPDRLEIKVRIAEVESGKVLDTILLVGSSKWATMGGDHPQDLLEKPVAQYVDSLYN